MLTEFYLSMNPNLSKEQLTEAFQLAAETREKMWKQVTDGIAAMPDAESKVKYLSAVLPLLLSF